jgi:hypothetical protein
MSVINQIQYKSVEEFCYFTCDFDFTALIYNPKHKTFWARNLESVWLKNCSVRVNDIAWVHEMPAMSNLTIDTLMVLSGYEQNQLYDNQYSEDREFFINSISSISELTMLQYVQNRKIKNEIMAKQIEKDKILAPLSS